MLSSVFNFTGKTTTLSKFERPKLRPFSLTSGTHEEEVIQRFSFLSRILSII